MENMSGKSDLVALEETKSSMSKLEAKKQQTPRSSVPSNLDSDKNIDLENAEISKQIPDHLSTNSQQNIQARATEAAQYREIAMQLQEFAK